MRIRSLIVFCAVLACPFVASARETVAARDKGAIASASSNTTGSYSWRNGRRWYQSADGQSYLWARGQWVRTAAPGRNDVPQRTTATRVQTESNTYQCGDLGPIVGGIPWYLNGRGPFSD
jgi:hypothetical protein